MSNKHDLKLDVLSNLDDDIIEKNLLKRFELWHKKGRVLLVKRLTPILALAACFCIMFSALFMILLGGKEVPVYTGMTVSTTSPIASAKSDGLFGFFSLEDPRYAMLDNSNKAPNVEDNNGNHNGQNKHTEPPTEEITEAPTEAPWDPNASGAKPLFYANKGQDFYITVHIDNPDNFEIVSFTLNGKKYSSYMFEEGSDMENLVLKCNAGDAVGIIEYTIDAIKYIDGTTIKDVKIGGAQTIRVGLYSEEIQPDVLISDSASTYDNFALALTVSDEYKLISSSEGSIRVELYKASTLMETVEVETDALTPILFEGLEPETEYSYKVIADYDSLDGKEKAEYEIYSQAFTTEKLFTVTANEEHHKVSFEYSWHSLANENSILAITLIDADGKETELDKNTTEIGELLSDNVYTLRIKYSNKGVERVKNVTLSTLKYETPTAIYDRVVSDHTKIEINVKETDEYGLGNATSVSLYDKNGELISTVEITDMNENGKDVVFDGLLSGAKYTLSVAYVYDKKDGKGEQNAKIDKEISTKAYIKPTVSFDSFSSSFEDVDFSYEYEDVDSRGRVSGIELLLLGDTAKTVKNAGIQTTSFNGLLPGESYAVKISIEYDLNDGNGKITESIYKSFYTQSEGLKIENGVITGIGSCTDSTVYLCLPVAQNALRNTKTIEKIYFNSEKYVDENGNVINKKHSVGAGAFYGCTQLTDVSLKYFGEIGSSAFENCIRLVNASLENGSGAIGSLAYKGCVNLKAVSFKDTTSSLGANAFQNCANLTSADLGKISSIGNSAFEGCASLENVVMSSSLEGLGVSAFKGCSKLTGITLPDSLKNIGASAFEGCSGITSLVLPNGLNSIGASAFKGCSKLTGTTLPDSLKNIGASAFEGCSGITSLVLPNDLNSIGASAFAGCSGLEGSIVIPSNVKVISNNLFDGCSKLKHIEIHNGITSIGAYAFSGCENIESINIPTALNSIGAYAFKNCTKLDGTIVIPDVILNISDGLFYGCESLDKIVVSDFVTNIGIDAFNGCGAKELVGLSFIEAIGDGAFRGYKELKSAEFLLVKSVGAYAFADCTALTSVKLPLVTSIKEDTFSGCTSLSNFDFSAITSIGGYAFSGCASLSTVNLPLATRIEESTFSGCTKLTTVDIPLVTLIESFAFSGCTKLANINMPSVTTIYLHAFENCTSLKRVDFSSKIQSIENYAFYNSGLTDVYYDGTISMWKNHYGYKSGNPDFTVHCTDGDIVYPLPEW